MVWSNKQYHTRNKKGEIVVEGKSETLEGLGDIEDKGKNLEGLGGIKDEGKTLEGLGDIEDKGRTLSSPKKKSEE